ncbi:MAG: RagB/SusD family nutrient uptake outer membrane protein [Tidjanibacter sp.]|nr:RagB/SusD family nutrient uptake outer membrane protein [Tidjanibacter sp.]
MKAMKKIAYIIMMIAASASLYSCSDFLDVETKSEFDESVVFSNYTLAEYNVFGISDAFGQTNGHRGRYLPYYGFNTDIEWNNNTDAGDKRDLSAYNTKTGNGQMSNSNGPFECLYTGVERANLCIAGLKKHGNIENDPEMAYLYGEALVLRAVLYHDLLKGWGDVPARFEPINSETIYIPKSNRDVIYKQLLADLETAIPMLYWPGEKAQTMRTDRISKSFAIGMYARLALAASGYALRPDEGMLGTNNPGSVRKTDDADLQASVLYPKALNYLKQAINQKCNSLYGNYIDLWKATSDMDLTAGKETLFVIPFSDGRGRWNYSFAIKDDDFSGRGGNAGPVPTLYFDYDSDDVRRDISCVNWKWGKGHIAEPSNVNNWYFGKYRFEWQIKAPYGGGNDCGVKPIVMRYADILLMAAEIANSTECGARDETFAKNCLLEVRERAFKGNESEAQAYVNALSGEENIQLAIEEERKLEFVGEFLRKGDLIRWGKLGSKLTETKQNLIDLANLQGKYTFLSGDLYWKDNGAEGITIYGLEPNQKAAPAGAEGEWTHIKEYIKPDRFYSDKSKVYAYDVLFENDPDTRQFWPLFDATCVANTQLKNDYGYAGNDAEGGK